MSASQDHTRAVGLLVLASLCWSLGGVLIKFIDWPPLAVAGARGLIAALFLGLAVRPLRFTGSKLQLAAAIAYAACTILFVTATKLTTAANAILLQYTAPIYIALAGAWFLGERTTLVDWVTIVVALGGMGLFFADGLQFEHLFGNMIAIASGVAFAAMALLLRKQKGGSAAESIILGNLLAALIGAPAMFNAPELSTQGWLALLVLGSIQLGLSYFFFARAIKHVTALESVLIPVVEPILNPLWVLLALHERPGSWALVGGVIVIVAITGRAVYSFRTTSPLRLGERREAIGPG